MFVPGCMWQTMHWLVGIARVKTCFSGCPERFFGIIGSCVSVNPWLPALAYAAECTGDSSLAYMT